VKARVGIYKGRMVGTVLWVFFPFCSFCWVFHYFLFDFGRDGTCPCISLRFDGCWFAWFSFMLSPDSLNPVLFLGSWLAGVVPLTTGLNWLHALHTLFFYPPIFESFNFFLYLILPPHPLSAPFHA
jgi:hypothetical protein